MNTIAIIGGGFAGTLTAVNLIEQGQGPLKIVHIEAAEKRSRGSPIRLLARCICSMCRLGA